MFDHVTIRVSDRTASERFYESVLQTLGIEQTHRGAAATELAHVSLPDAVALCLLLRDREPARYPRAAG